RAALAALYERTAASARSARPLADALHDAFLPDSLATAPKAALPYLVVRDTFIQRTYALEGGYWRANGDGIDEFTRDEWGVALDKLGDGSDASFVRAADGLLQSGDSPLALRIVDIGLARHPSSEELRARRARALDDLRARYGLTNPFRFIVYS